jgi:hypothetical protein
MLGELGRDSVYGHFAWMRIYLEIGPQHSFDSQKGFMTPKHLRTTAVEFDF